MHCKATSNGGSACYVRNFGQFEGSSLQALTELVEHDTPLATVVMVYTPPIDAPNAVTFMVYDGNDDLQDSAQLDLNGNNQSIPQNCMNCHGGQSAYDVPSHTATNARFLPFDPAAFQYATVAGFSFASQESAFRAVNRLVEQSAPTPAVTAVVDGMFPQDGSPYNATWVPAAWSTSPRDAQVYTDAIAPYCRSCHATMTGPLAFQTAADFRGLGPSTILQLCGKGPRGMPTAEQTSIKFFNSGARALIIDWLNAATSCAPQ